ncbi:MAG: hypothetical protein N3G20_01140, partial [Verrucomicrobiae bacterium]|nr:hypothetical protein [Verrucomicrobiae bacterium]
TVAKWTVEITGTEAPEETGYIEMTRRIIDSFPHNGGEFVVEPDASSGAYFLGAGWLLSTTHATQQARSEATDLTMLPKENTLPVRVKNWPDTTWQIDARFPVYLPLPRTISRTADLGDAIMMAIVLAADRDSGQEWKSDPAHPGFYVSFEGLRRPATFTHLGRLRLQECDRVSALRTELQRCGACVVERADTLEVIPAELHGAEIETYNDHRMAMCFSILGLKVPGIRIKNPACVKKTFPDFFLKLALPEPLGLDATIVDARTGRKLDRAELIAD